MVKASSVPGYTRLLTAEKAPWKPSKLPVLGPTKEDPTQSGAARGNRTLG